MKERREIFWDNYNRIKQEKSLLEHFLPAEDIGRVRRIIYNSLKGIKKGNYKKVYGGVQMPHKFLSESVQYHVCSIMNAYLNAFHAAVPNNLIENKYD
ncbi:hypothetical protein HYT26_03445, partial [Candidatus Pacearchaeota archaeon]|nr:hypothetical protein [Candidatus Pacearchaeota archaeon]